MNRREQYLSGSYSRGGRPQNSDPLGGSGGSGGSSDGGSGGGGSHSSQSDSPKPHSSQSETNLSGAQNDAQRQAQQQAQQQAAAARQQEIDRQKQIQRDRAEAEKQAAAQKAADQLAADQKRRDAALRAQQRQQAEAEEEERLKNIQDLHRQDLNRRDQQRKDAQRQDDMRRTAAERLFTGHVTEERKKRREAQDLIEKNQRDPKNGYHTTPADPMDAHLRSLETPNQTRNRKHTELASTMWPTGNTRPPINLKTPPNTPSLPGVKAEYAKNLQQAADDARREKQLTELQGPNNAKNRRLTHISNSMWPNDADGPTTKDAQRKADQALLDQLEAEAVTKEAQKRVESLALQDRYNPGAFDAFLSMADPDWQQAQVSLGANTGMTNTSGQNTSVQNTGHSNMHGAYSPPSGASSSPDPPGQDNGQTLALSPIDQLMAYGSTPQDPQGQDHSGYTRPALPTSQSPTSQPSTSPQGDTSQGPNNTSVQNTGHPNMRGAYSPPAPAGTDVETTSGTDYTQETSAEKNHRILQWTYDGIRKNPIYNNLTENEKLQLAIDQSGVKPTSLTVLDSIFGRGDPNDTPLISPNSEAALGQTTEQMLKDREHMMSEGYLGQRLAAELQNIEERDKLINSLFGLNKDEGEETSNADKNSNTSAEKTKSFSELNEYEKSELIKNLLEISHEILKNFKRRK